MQRGRRLGEPAAPTPRRTRGEAPAPLRGGARWIVISVAERPQRGDEPLHVPSFVSVSPLCWAQVARSESTGDRGVQARRVRLIT